MDNETEEPETKKRKLSYIDKDEGDNERTELVNMALDGGEANGTAAVADKERKKDNAEVVKIVETVDDDKGESQGLHDMAILNIIGQGCYGTVHMCQMKQSKRFVALKKVNSNEGEKEANIMQKLKHPFVMPALKSFREGDFTYIVMPLMVCDMSDFVKSHTLHETEVSFYAAEIISAVTYLHSMHVVHRDIKLQNILLTNKGHINLGDFGSSDCTEEEAEENQPNVLTSFKYGRSHDFCSTGRALLHMLSGSSECVLTELTSSGKISENAISLLNNLFEVDMFLRLEKCSHIQHHIFFKLINWERLLNGDVIPPFIPEYSEATRDIILTGEMADIGARKQPSRKVGRYEEHFNDPAP